MIWRRWINSFTVFTIHRTTKDLNKSSLFVMFLFPLFIGSATVSIMTINIGPTYNYKQKAMLSWNLGGGGENSPVKVTLGYSVQKTLFNLRGRAANTDSKTPLLVVNNPLFHVKFGIWIGGGGVPFWRWRVCKAQKTPFFSIAVSHRPHIFTVAWALTQRPIFFHLICHSMPHDLKSWHLKKILCFHRP